MEVDKQRKCGLVLAGGGAKGAFQAGVWKAMCELGIAGRVKVISGTSVGAINAAAFASLRDPDRIRDLWLHHVGDVVTFNPFNIAKIIPALVDAAQGKSFPFLGIFDRPGLEAILREVIRRPIFETGIDIYATAVACIGNVTQTLDRSGYALKRFRLNGETNPGRIRKMILASSSIPWGFDPVDINGVRYIDGASYLGGVGDNVPIAPILERHLEIETIYVVRCNSRAVDPFEPMKIPGKRIVEICPRHTLPGMFDNLNATNNPCMSSWSGVMSFNADYARRYFNRGYADAMQALRPPILEAKLEW